MNRLRLSNQGLGLSAFCMITTTIHAGIPVWSFSPNGSPAVTVSATGTATVSYTVTNNSKKPHQLVLSSKTPTGISQMGGPCVLAAKSPANPNPTCIVTLSINGSALPANNLSGGPSLCQTNSNGTANTNQCYQPDPNDILVITRTTTPGATTLSTSVPPPSILALSVRDISTNAALTGNARYITIKNTGTNQATGLSVSATGLPTGTNITTVPTTCTGTLDPNATCTVTINPGSDATSSAPGVSCNTGTVPAPGTITVSATNVGTPVTSNVVVLSYGCQYQSGYLYSVDDTTNNGVTGTCTAPPCTKSIGGTVVSLADQVPPSPGIIWSSNGAGSYSYDIIPGIDETSTSTPVNQQPSYATFAGMFNYPTNTGATYTNSVPSPALAFSTCDGSSDGHCDSGNIMLFYNLYQTHYSTSCDPQRGGSGGCTAITPAVTLLTNYAAGLCYNDTDGGASNGEWYLPAICEMGPASNGSGCAGTQNIVEDFPAILGTSCALGINCLSGGYWSSTEYSGFPQDGAWYQYFASGGGSIQDDFVKFVQRGVRCSRALTI